MPREFTILTVCDGNIHRSPLAEALLRLWSSWYLPPALADVVRIGSAGLIAPVGAPMGRRVARIAHALGVVDAEHRARLLTDNMIRHADLVLTATARQRDTVIGRVPAALKVTMTVREAGQAAQALRARGLAAPPTTEDDLRRIVASLNAERAGGAKDVIDPQGHGDAVFLRMTSEAVPALCEVATILLGMPVADRDAYVEGVSDPARLAQAAGLDASSYSAR